MDERGPYQSNTLQFQTKCMHTSSPTVPKRKKNQFSLEDIVPSHFVNKHSARRLIQNLVFCKKMPICHGRHSGYLLNRGSAIA